MTKKTRASLHFDKNSNLPDNDHQLIAPENVRFVLGNIIDSAILDEDYPSHAVKATNIVGVFDDELDLPSETVQGLYAIVISNTLHKIYSTDIDGNWSIYSDLSQDSKYRGIFNSQQSLPAATNGDYAFVNNNGIHLFMYADSWIQISNVHVTGGSYSNGTLTLTSSDGTSFSISGFSGSSPSPHTAEEFVGIFENEETLEANYPTPTDNMQAIVLNPVEMYYHVTNGAWHELSPVVDSHSDYLGVFLDYDSLPSGPHTDGAIALTEQGNLCVWTASVNKWEIVNWQSVLQLELRVGSNEQEIELLKHKEEKAVEEVSTGRALTSSDAFKKFNLIGDGGIDVTMPDPTTLNPDWTVELYSDSGKGFISRIYGHDFAELGEIRKGEKVKAYVSGSAIKLARVSAYSSKQLDSSFANLANANWESVESGTYMIDALGSEIIGAPEVFDLDDAHRYTMQLVMHNSTIDQTVSGYCTQELMIESRSFEGHGSLRVVRGGGDFEEMLFNGWYVPASKEDLNGVIGLYIGAFNSTDDLPVTARDGALAYIIGSHFEAYHGNQWQPTPSNGDSSTLSYYAKKGANGLENGSLIEDTNHITATKPIYAPNIQGAPTQNEIITIGSGGDYETLNLFLEAQQHRPKSNFNVQGRFLDGYQITEPVEIHGGNFTNVFINKDSLSPIIYAGADTPFTFFDCHPTPKFDIDLLVTGLADGKSIFNHTDCTVPIIDFTVTKASGEAPHFIYELTRCNTFQSYWGDIVINDCDDVIFDVQGGELHLARVTMTGTGRLFDLQDGATVTTSFTDSTPFHVAHNSNGSAFSPMINALGGSRVLNMDLAGSNPLNGLICRLNTSYLANCTFEYPQASQGLDCYFSDVRALTIDVGSFNNDSVRVYNGSNVELSMAGVATTGGEMFVQNSNLRVNKAESIDYEQGSIVKVDTLVRQPSNPNTVTKDGVLFYPTATARSGSGTVLAGFNYTPDLAADKEFVHITLILIVLEISTKYLNSYEIKVLQRNSGAEIVSITELGDTEHNFTDASTFSVGVADGFVRLSVPTTGSGEELLIQHDITYSR